MFYEVCIISKSRGCVMDELPIISSMLLNIRSMSNDSLIFVWFIFLKQKTHSSQRQQSQVQTSQETLGFIFICSLNQIHAHLERIFLVCLQCFVFMGYFFHSMFLVSLVNHQDDSEPTLTHRVTTKLRRYAVARQGTRKVFHGDCLRTVA